MYELKVISRFAAAHQLEMVAHKCENLHGHNWRVEVYIWGKELNPAGVLVDFGEIKHHLSTIIRRLDHKFLNELDLFNQGNPSSENIARYIAVHLDQKLPKDGPRVSRVAVWESDDCCATFYMKASRS